MVKIGERVGAVLSAKAGVINFLGYGIYEGDFIPEEAKGFMVNAMIKAGRTNPRIKLDSGKCVYGCECWWGPEDSIKEKLSQYKVVVDVDIDKFREECDKK